MPDAPEAKVRAVAGSLGFSAQNADKKVEKLSGGEKARLMLGLATFGGPHLLILDEPTNHLDIDSRSALIEAINEYAGAVILVSHDRHLLDACADRLWLVADGKVTTFDGDLDDYRRRVLSDRDDGSGSRRGERAAQSSHAIPTSAPPSRARPPSRCASAWTAPKPRSPGSPAKSKSSTRRSPTARCSARDPAKAAALSRTRADNASALAKAEEDWLAAGAALEAATG